MITVSLEKARQFHIKALRTARVKLLERIDIERAVATDSDDKAALAAIKARAKELRDVTKHPKLLSAKTLDEIRAFWPGCMGLRTAH